MRSPSVFEDLGRDFMRLDRPGYWQNRRGFAFSPHEPLVGVEAAEVWSTDMGEKQERL